MKLAKMRNVSIGDLDMQLSLLMIELSNYQLIGELKETESVREASDLILCEYEKPLDQSEEMQERRAGYAQSFYNKYSENHDLDDEEEDSKDEDIDDETTDDASEETEDDENCVADDEDEEDDGECVNPKMTNSSLAMVTILSPNHSGRRDHVIDTVTIHCMAGNLSVQSCGNWFAQRAAQASSNYGIDSDGNIGLYVEECNRSWCSSNGENDNRAVTIEVANDGGAETGWHVSDKAYHALIDLLVDICKRNHIKQLLWRGDRNLIGQVDKQNMTVHRWFAAKACPGDYLYSLHPRIAAEVNARLQKQEDEDMNAMSYEKWKEYMSQYRSELQDNDCGEWSEEARAWAIDNGIISGIKGDSGEDMNFAWEDHLTREQAITLIFRFAKLLDNKLKEQSNE